jgi:hypothetical protein
MISIKAYDELSHFYFISNITNFDKVKQQSSKAQFFKGTT